jgi:hypothetical protein
MLHGSLTVLTGGGVHCGGLQLSVWSSLYEMPVGSVDVDAAAKSVDVGTAAESVACTI